MSYFGDKIELFFPYPLEAMMCVGVRYKSISACQFVHL